MVVNEAVPATLPLVTASFSLGQRVRAQRIFSHGFARYPL